ncbi:Male sterility NAD-binding [Penicillium alfredii]|uniref:Male sterility NAD-binding n=1 Tax=Penicillium alfredii TaxID=1506179 RepID=A0A9W9GBJ6_9EURO|nr:Male sterility NAD-binding [Penicillium alfredii]KAJ5115010.1 Male sterility NAD-binding [Penicillium alfredii]
MEDEGPNTQTEIILSYQDVAGLVNKLAWWLSDNGVRRESSNGVIAYLGPSDLRHLLIPLAAVRVGTKVLLLSPRNSAFMHESLLQVSRVSLLLYDHTFENMANEMSHKQHIDILSVNNLVDLMSGIKKVEAYPYEETWESAFSNPLVILHTTGSTGMPKPITVSHSALAAIDAQRLISVKDPAGGRCQLEILAEAKTVYTAFPIFHVAGFELSCYLLFSGCILLLGYPRQPPSIAVLRRVLKLPEVDGALLPPSIIDELSQEPELLTEVSKLRWIFYGGGSIAKRTGDLVVTKTRLLNGIGSTEVGSFIQYPTDPLNWNYFHFHPSNGIRWRPISIDSEGQQGDEFELVLQRDDSCILYQGVFQNFPCLQEWATKDVFRKHPSIIGYWEYRYRLDDLIVFSTGKKMNPVPFETRLNGVPGIKAALVIGNKRSYPGLLLETDSSSQGECNSHFLQPPMKSIIKEVLEIENFQSSRDAQVTAEAIIIATPDKPFVRTGKGSVHRNKTLTLYESEIDDLYSSTQFPDSLNCGHPHLDLSSEESLSSNLIELIGKLVPKIGELNAYEDIFATGLDSKQTQILAAAVNKTLANQTGRGGPDSRPIFSADVVYGNPTAQKMANVILRRLFAPEQEIRDLKEFYTILQRHSEHLPDAPADMVSDTLDHTKRHVLLTGSTGFVGSYTLDALVRRKNVSRVTCLNRRGTHRSKTWIQSFPNDEAKSTAIRFDHMRADLAEGTLGLAGDVYNELLDSVTDILHCQWPVDFNYPLNYFDPSIHGVVNLINFAHGTKNNAHIIFLSTVATVKHWAEDMPVPEEPLTSPQNAETGYGESKLVASLLLDQAGQSANVQSTICRLGQVAGPVKEWREGSEHAWPRRDWFPSLLSSSFELGCLPGSLGPADQIDWIPVDVVAEILADLLCSPNMHKGDKDGHATRYCHIVNPQRTYYAELVPFLAERLGGPHKKMRIVSLKEWVGLLAEKGLDEQSLRRQPIPGVQLLDFFQRLAHSPRQGSVTLKTTVTERWLPRLTSIDSVNELWMGMWLEQWGMTSPRS